MMPSGIQRRAPLTPLPDEGHQHQRPAAPATTTNSQGANFSQIAHRHLERDQRGDKADAPSTWHGASGSGCARSRRTSGCRAARSRPNTPSPGPRPAAPPRPSTSGWSKPLSACARRDCTWSRTGSASAPGGRPPTQPARHAAASASRWRAAAAHARSCQHLTRVRRPARCTASHEHLGAVLVVVEHVKAGAGRADISTASPAWACSCTRPRPPAWLSASSSGTPHVGQRGANQRRIAADQHHGAGIARHRRGQRREVLPLAVAAQNHAPACGARRPDPASAATVAPTLVPLLSSKYSTPSTMPIGSTRCGSPRYSRRPYSMGASAQPVARGQRQRRQRVGGVVAAADAQRIGRHQALDVQLFGRFALARA